MPTSTADEIIDQLNRVEELYHRLLLLVAPSGSGKTAALQDVAARTGAQLTNLNLQLSRRMLELTERQRALELPPSWRREVSLGWAPRHPALLARGRPSQ